MLIFRGVGVVFYEIYGGFSNTMSQNWADRNKNQDLLLEATYINLRESGKNRFKQFQFKIRVQRNVHPPKTPDATILEPTQQHDDINTKSLVVYN